MMLWEILWVIFVLGVLPIIIFINGQKKLNEDFERLGLYYAQNEKPKTWKPYREPEDKEDLDDFVEPLELDQYD